MKKIRLTGILLLITVLCFISGCTKSESEILGEYTYEDIVLSGGISSLTIDALRELNVDKKYRIEDNSFSVINEDSETIFSDISFQKIILDEESIKTMYGDFDGALLDFFDRYKMKVRYSIYNEDGEKINFCIYLMDEEVFISRFAKTESIFFSIDKITKID